MDEQQQQKPKLYMLKPVMEVKKNHGCTWKRRCSNKNIHLMNKIKTQQRNFIE